MFSFFSICFQHGLSPYDWSLSDIKPVEKPGKDPRIPLNQRPITIMDNIAKIYSSILNARIQKHLADCDLLADEQNGFRATRSCLDHIFSLITLLRKRKAQGKSTFICFVDYKLAFDSINRTLLFHKLPKFGIVGKMYNALSSLYLDPKARVILNDIPTDYFQCLIGCKQGCCLSPTLFSIFANDLSTELKKSGVGIVMQDQGNQQDDNLNLTEENLINHLLYADDLVCIAETEADLQKLLDVINSWCQKNRLTVNLLKTNVMHVRPTKTRQSTFHFKIGNETVNYCSAYTYLGTQINQHLNFNKTAESQKDSASRALGAILCKMKKCNGFPLNEYKMIVENCVFLLQTMVQR